MEKAHWRVGSREGKESSFGNRVTAAKGEVARWPRVGAWRRREGGQGALSCRKGQGFVHTEHVQGDNCKHCREGPSLLGNPRGSQADAPGCGVEPAERRIHPEHKDGGSLVLARMAARRFCSKPYEQG